MESKEKTGLWLIITGAGQVWRFVVSLASTVILGRLLLPSDFGLLATLAPIIAVVDLIRDLGFSQAIVQRKEITPAQANGLFWISMFITSFLSIGLIVSSGIVAETFREPRLSGLMIAQAFSLLVSSSSAQAFAYLSRQLRFDLIALTDCIGATFGLFVSVLGALGTHSYWAIFAGGVAQTLLSLVLASIFSGWRPGRPILDVHVFAMAKFGAGVSISNFCNFLSRNMDNILIAKAYGPAQLGLYDRAYKLMLLPLSQVSWPVGRVLIPLLSRLQENREGYRSIYDTVVTGLLAVTQPGMIFAAAFSIPLVDRLLGPHWAGVPPIFSWLAIAGLFQMATGSFNWVFVSQGRSSEMAGLGVVTSISTVVAFITGLSHGPIGVAAAYAITEYLIRIPISLFVVRRQGFIDTALLTKMLLPHLVASLLCGGAVILLNRLSAGETIWQLVSAFLAAYLAYGLVLIAFPQKFRMMMALVRRIDPKVLVRAAVARMS